MATFVKTLSTTEIALYQSVLQKLGQVMPQDLSILDAFLTNLVNQGKQAKPVSKSKKQLHATQSPMYWLEQLAKSNAFSGIENPVEWQREIRNDRQLSR
ncbi:MAG: hypothetical protein HY842_13400 [Bacteroidetes bacterium]|nr:hypothetical protein [Bacteroidota bacterium]